MDSRGISWGGAGRDLKKEAFVRIWDWRGSGSGRREWWCTSSGNESHFNNILSFFKVKQLIDFSLFESRMEEKKRSTKKKERERKPCLPSAGSHPKCMQQLGGAGPAHSQEPCPPCPCPPRVWDPDPGAVLCCVPAR